MDVPSSATESFARWWAGFAPAFLIALGLLFLTAAQVRAAPPTQGVPGASPQLYLLPQDASAADVVLETHIATIRILPTGDGAVVDAQYSLRNPTDEAVSVPIRLLPGGDRSLGPAQAVSLTDDGEALALTPDDDGYTGVISLAADGRLSLRLVYQVDLGDGPLVAVRYAPAVLNAWPGNISLRVELLLPDAIPPESWVQVMPSTWRYSLVEEADVTGIHWLYDFSAPDTPFRFQFVIPDMWAGIVTAEAAATGNASVTDSLRLGDLYRSLARTANDAAVRARFHAQAVAAYQAGLASAGWGLAAPQDKAAIFLGLADLYRSQLVDAEAQPAYAELLVDAATQALTLLPSGDAHRHEVTLWQADGLHLLLNNALARRDWPAAIVYLDRLTALPSDLVDPTQLAEERDAILIQQALQLMEQGNREAALAVAGDQIAADALVPPAEAASLFVGWQITVTAAPDAVQMVIVGLTTPDRAEAATAALQQVVATWQTGIAGDAGGMSVTLDPATPDPAGGIRVMLDFDTAANGFLLAHLLPPRPDYALLRSLLTQLAPTVERRRALFWQEIVQRQPLDLAGAVAEWTAIAAGLEQQAAAFDAQGGNLASADPATAEAALAAAIQAVNYRTAATDWRRLARQSWLQFTFRVDDPLFAQLRDEPPSRAWTITADSPSQTLVFQTQVLDLTRVLAASAATLAGLITLSAALWGLL